MSAESSYEWRRQLMWGLVLVLFGLTILLDRMDLIEVRSLWRYWPLVMIVIGINKMIGYPTPGHYSSGLWMMFMGVWLFAVFQNMFGLTFGNSWPFVIIASGVSIMLRPFINKRFAANEEKHHEK